MASPAWLTRWLTDVPSDDCWLSRHELDVLAGLSVEKRRADWRLGRFAGKAAVAAWLDVAPTRVEIAAAANGAPGVRIDGRPAPVALSLSHRAGRALAVVGDAGSSLGCDLELVEPRSEAFVGDWLAPAERRYVAHAGSSGRTLVANLLWTAKEAAAKVRQEGLRLDLRDAVAEPEGLDSPPRKWHPLVVSWTGDGRTMGWWRADRDWVMAVAGKPPPQMPRSLE